MRIQLLTEYVDNVFSVLKKEFNLEEEFEDAFYLNPFLHFLLLYKEGEIIGYLRFDVLYDKAEIVYIYIKQKFRNCGYGSLLMKELFNFCQNNKMTNVTLEVSKLNNHALALYKKYGFAEVAIRKGYYHGIDGILMERKMM